MDPSVVSTEEQQNIHQLMDLLAQIYTLFGFNREQTQAHKVAGRHIIFDKQFIKRLGTFSLTVFTIQLEETKSSTTFELQFDRNDYGDPGMQLAGQPIKSARISLAGSNYRQCTMEINLVKPRHYQQTDFVYYLRSEQGVYRLGAPWLQAEGQIATTEAIEVVGQIVEYLKRN